MIRGPPRSPRFPYTTLFRVANGAGANATGATSANIATGKGANASGDTGNNMAIVTSANGSGNNNSANVAIEDRATASAAPATLREQLTTACCNKHHSAHCPR